MTTSIFSHLRCFDGHQISRHFHRANRIYTIQKYTLNSFNVTIADGQPKTHVDVIKISGRKHEPSENKIKSKRKKPYQLLESLSNEMEPLLLCCNGAMCMCDMMYAWYICLFVSMITAMVIIKICYVMARSHTL